MSELRVLIVAEHASAKFGGEAILPLHYFRRLRRRGIESWLVVHARTRDELSALLPEESGRIFYVPDTRTHRLLYAMSKPFPRVIQLYTFEFVMGLLTQFLARRIVRRLVAEHRIDVVHQPIPVSPKLTSIMHGVGAPVVIGPMNGGMEYPEAFRRFESGLVRSFTRIGRSAAQFMNLLMPGKVRAQTLLVANERTRKALPAGVQGKVIELVENGVDLSLWQPAEERPARDEVRFVFVGRLVDWKAADLLLEALQRVPPPATLDIIGSGPEQGKLEALARSLGIADRVRFLGWLAQADAARELRSADVFVLPSLFECGGAVVLEAMASGLPVIATAWGGPADYLDPSCGILVPPTSRDDLVAGLARAMSELAASPERRLRLGQAGREKAVREYDWERKIDRILEIYQETVERYRGSGTFHSPAPAPSS